MPSKDEQRQDKTRQDEQEQSARPPIKPNGHHRGPRPADPAVYDLQLLAEELTGRASVMADVFGGLGLKAVAEQLEPYGLPRVEAAWREVAGRYEHPTLRQIVFGADDLLNPVRRVEPREKTREEVLAAIEAGARS